MVSFFSLLFKFTAVTISPKVLGVKENEAKMNIFIRAFFLSFFKGKDSRATDLKIDAFLYYGTSIFLRTLKNSVLKGNVSRKKTEKN